MMKVVPYIFTLGCEKFRLFLIQPFNIDMLSSVTNNNLINILFDGWHGKDMVNWYKFINNDKIILEFFSTYYLIKTESRSLSRLPIPLTINDFINDMTRFNIQLYWTNWIDKNFEPKDFLNKNDISKYYVDLLDKMGKSHELL